MGKDTFSLPCTYQDLTGKGWAIVEWETDPADFSLDSSYAATFTLAKGDTELGIELCNASASTTTADNCTVTCLTSTTCHFRIAEIRDGMAIADVTALLGEPTSVSDGLYNYQTPGIGLRLFADDQDKVSGFIYSHDHFVDAATYAPTDAQAALLAAYQPPEAIGESDPLDAPLLGVCGKLYRFPCPLGAFTENGWTVFAVDTYGADTNNFRRAGIRLYQGPYSLNLLVRSNGNTGFSDCEVYGLEQDCSPNLWPQLSYPGGVTYGMSLDDFHTLLDAFSAGYTGRVLETDLSDVVVCQLTAENGAETAFFFRAADRTLTFVTTDLPLPKD